jgi:hypothetical protein
MLFRTLGVALALILLAMGARPSHSELPAYNGDKLPYRARWGPYSLVVDAVPGHTEESDPRQVLRLTDASGKLVKEVRGNRFAVVEAVELTGKGGPELHATTFTGGAHCCSTEYYFTRDGGTVRNLLVFDSANGGINGHKDLNGDGRREILAANDAFAYFEGIAYAFSPHVPMTLAWDGTRYTDATAKFPARARQEARYYQTEFLKARAAKDELAEETRRALALGYYANLAAVGEEARAAAWLRKNAPRPSRDWVLRRAPLIRRTLLASRKKIGASQARVVGSWCCDEP